MWLRIKLIFLCIFQIINDTRLQKFVGYHVCKRVLKVLNNKIFVMVVADIRTSKDYVFFAGKSQTKRRSSVRGQRNKRSKFIHGAVLNPKIIDNCADILGTIGSNIQMLRLSRLIETNVSTNKLLTISTICVYSYS